MTDRRIAATDRRREFLRLHEAGCFVIPNPWDVGSVRFLQSLGFKALAARLMAEKGRFDGFETAMSGRELDLFFRSDSSGRVPAAP